MRPPPQGPREGGREAHGGDGDDDSNVSLSIADDMISGMNESLSASSVESPKKKGKPPTIKKVQVGNKGNVITKRGRVEVNFD